MVTPRIGQYEIVTQTGAARNYDVSPNGEPFLMLKREEQEQSRSRINAVLILAEELEGSRAHWKMNV